MDPRFAEKLNRPRAESGNVEPPLALGGGPPHDGGVEARIAKLENAVEYIQRDVGEIKGDLRALATSAGTVRTDVATITQRLTHMPTTLTMWFAIAACVAVPGGFVVWAVKEYLAPILAQLSGAK